MEGSGVWIEFLPGFMSGVWGGALREFGKLMASLTSQLLGRNLDLSSLVDHPEKSALTYFGAFLIFCPCLSQFACHNLPFGHDSKALSDGRCGMLRAK
ncbi:hypothetical protein Ddc_06646 [Ditylenchus destructor]|nr:hypothetical protein Ddc_06646 [Ditylenchus destructor]